MNFSSPTKEQVDAELIVLAKYRKKLHASKASAKAFLIRAGLLTPEGKPDPRYYAEPVTDSGKS
jgi:hypothetical protein